MNQSHIRVLELSTGSRGNEHGAACLTLARFTKGSRGCGSQLATQEL